MTDTQKTCRTKDRPDYEILRKYKNYHYIEIAADVFNTMRNYVIIKKIKKTIKKKKVLINLVNDIKIAVFASRFESDSLIIYNNFNV